jgi:hypothetical protein
MRIKDKSILPRIAMAQNTFEQTARTVTILGVHEEYLYGNIKATNVTFSDSSEETKKETLEEVLMREAIDEKGTRMILSIERTIKTESRGKWTLICGSSHHQDLIEQYLESKLERLYAQCETKPIQVNYGFGKPRVSGGDLRSVAESYVSALTDLPDLAQSDEEQSMASVARAPKRLKGRSVMVEAGSDTIYAEKPRSTWASRVKADGTTATSMTQGTSGTVSTTAQEGTNTGPLSVSSAGHSTLTAQTKQEIVLANRLESYKRVTEKQIKELKETMADLEKKLVETEERMEQQADVLATIMEQNTLTKEKIDMSERNNASRMNKLDNNMELMMTHMGLMGGHKTDGTASPSPARKRKTKRTNNVKKKAPTPEKPMDMSMENNSFGVFAEDNEEEETEDVSTDMLASDEEVATVMGYETPEDSDDSESSRE